MGGWGSLKKVLVGLVAAVVILAVIVDLSDGNFGESITSPPKEASDKKTKESPVSEGAGDYIPVEMRVSGDLGTPYSCSYTSFALEEGESDPVRYDEKGSGTLGNTPVVYTSQAINRHPWWYDFVSISCRNTSSGPRNPATGKLKAAIVVNGQVKAEEETRPDPPGKKSIESEHVQPRWAPRCPNREVDWDCG